MLFHSGIMEDGFAIQQEVAKGMARQSGTIGSSRIISLGIIFMKCCADYQDEPDFPGCCGSCHSDEEYDEDEYNLWRSEEYHVCCTVLAWLEGKGIDV